MKRLTTMMLFIALLQVSACQSSDQNAAADEDASAAPGEGSAGVALHEEDRGPSVELDDPLYVRYQFRVGDRFGYSIYSEENVNLDSEKQVQENVQKLTHWYRFEVLEATPGGGGRLRVTCDRVLFSGSYKSGRGENKIDYDSDADNTYDVEKRFAEHNAPVNAPFEIVVESNGRISAIEKLDAMVKNYLRDDYGTTRSQDLGGIMETLSQQKLKPVLQRAFQNLSQGPVAKDSTWVLTNLEHLGYLSYRSTAVYAVRDIVKSATGRRMHIDYDMTSQYVGKKEVDTGQGIATMDVFDVTGKGLTVFNMERGRVQRRKWRTDVDVRMYVEPPEELKQVAPQDAENFWWITKAFTEDIVEPYTLAAGQENIN